MTMPVRASELAEVLDGSAWFRRVLDVVAEVDPPEWWVGAGVIRDIVWDSRFGNGFDRGAVKDVPWQAKNQAAVHLWYAARFGIEVAPFSSAAEAIATFPETATAVAVRLERTGSIEVLAPHGLDDLLDGVWRWNPTRVTVAEYQRRLAKKDPANRWPAVRVLPADGEP